MTKETSEPSKTPLNRIINEAKKTNINNSNVGGVPLFGDCCAVSDAPEVE